MWLVAAVEISA